MLFVDIGYSMGIMKKVRRFAMDNQIMVLFEDLKLQIRQTAKEHMEKKHWFLQFKSEVSLGEHLKRYMELHDAFIGEEMREQFKSYIEDKKNN